MLLYERRSFHPISLNLEEDPFVDHGICDVCEPKPYQPHLENSYATCKHLQKQKFAYNVFITLSKLQTLQILMFDDETNCYSLPCNENGVYLFYGGLFEGLADCLTHIDVYYRHCLSKSPHSLPSVFKQISKRFFIKEVNTSKVYYEAEDNLSCSTSKEQFDTFLRKKIKRTRDNREYVNLVLDQKHHLIIFAEWLRCQISFYFNSLQRPHLPGFDKLIGALNMHKRQRTYCALDCLLDSWIVTNGKDGSAYFFSEKSLDDFFHGRREATRKAFSPRIDSISKKNMFSLFVTEVNKRFDYSKFYGFTIPEDSPCFVDFLSKQNQFWCTSC